MAAPFEFWDFFESLERLKLDASFCGTGVSVCMSETQSTDVATVVKNQCLRYRASCRSGVSTTSRPFDG